MAGPDPARLMDVRTRIQSGFRTHALSSEPRRRSIQLAEHLVTIYDDLDGPAFAELNRGEGLTQVLTRIDTDALQGLRKLTEVIEDDLLIDVGHSKLVRAASMASTFTSIGSFLIAGHGVLQSADQLNMAEENTESIMQIEGARFVDFYRSLGIFIAEGLLFWTPLNFNFAWRGTRYLNNRVLYKFRTINSGLYRLLLSEIHYAIRGIAPRALRNPDELVTYLSSVTMQTIEFVREFELDGSDVFNLIERAQNEVQQFHAFVANTYDIEIGTIDLGSIATDVIKQLADGNDPRSIYTPSVVP